MACTLQGLGERAPKIQLGPVDENGVVAAGGVVGDVGTGCCGRAGRRWSRLVATVIAGALVAAISTSTAPAESLPAGAGAGASGGNGTVTTAAVSGVSEITLTPDGAGAFLLSPSGIAATLGSARTYGAPPVLVAGERFVTMVVTASGYVLFSDRGRAFPAGDGRAFGDLGATPLNAPIVDVAATADGLGYWMLGADGGVFSFGSARFAGSTGNLRLNSPAIGLVPDPDGVGYWFVAGDGGVFAFDAPFRGSLGSIRLNRPVVGMIAYGNGYLMVGSDGGVFNFSDKQFFGSIGGRPELTSLLGIVGIAAGLAGDWYVLARSDGAIYVFGPGVPVWARALDGAPAPGGGGLPGGALPGNPAGGATVPLGAGLADTSRPDRVIGTGSPASCTSAAVVDAVARGGIITFNCGPDPLVITMLATAKVFNNTGPDIVIDGGGLVTLSGAGQRRILYMNTCDRSQVWTTSHCQDQDHPRLVVQNLGFREGSSIGETAEGGGGGAIFVRGGRLRIVNARFTGNVCDTTGTDVGGGAVRALSQSGGQPVYVVNSTFGGGPGLGNSCSNGGALSSIGVSWIVLNSVLTHNSAVGVGANPARAGTPGGGNGGAICLDGNLFTLTVAGTIINDNDAREGGGAIFFVSNNRTGTLRLEVSTLRRNPSRGFETAGYPGIFFLGSGAPTVISSTLSAASTVATSGTVST